MTAWTSGGNTGGSTGGALGGSTGAAAGGTDGGTGGIDPRTGQPTDASGGDKMGEAAPRLSLDEALGLPHERDVGLIALDDALTSLAALDPQQSRIVELRFFGGLSLDETAEMLGISPATVFYEWTLARAWLHRELKR